MALTWDDFKPFTYTSDGEVKNGFRMSITKSYVSKFGIVKVPKNFKFRQIPVVSHPAELYASYRDRYEGATGKTDCSSPDRPGKNMDSHAGHSGKDRISQAVISGKDSAPHDRISGNDRDEGSARICPVTYSPIDNALKCACADLGLPAYHLHEFRHSYISYLISKNIPLSVIEKLSGDTQNTILTRYSHCFGNGESAVIDALEELK